MNLFIYTGATDLTEAAVTAANNLTAVTEFPALVYGDTEPLAIRFTTDANGTQPSWANVAGHIIDVTVGELGSTGAERYAATSNFTYADNTYSGTIYLGTPGFANWVASRRNGKGWLDMQIRHTDTDGETETLAVLTCPAWGSVPGIASPETIPVTYADYADILASQTAAAGSAQAAAASAAAAASSAAVASEGTIVQWADLTSPYMIAHKGGSFVAPENTMEAFRYAVANGIRVLDMDAQVLSDGSLACFHYDTVDTLTTASGSTSDWHAATFPLLNMDADSWLAPAWPATVHPCLISDVFSAFGRSVLYTIEAKAATTAAVTSLVSLVQQFKMEDAVVIQSTSLSSLAPAVTAGIRTAKIGDTPDTAAITAAGVDHVVMSISSSDANIQSAVAAGLTTWVYNCTRHYDYDRVTALGAVGLISDDPVYTGRGSYKRTTDAFSQQTWYPGMIIATGSRGVFLSPDRWGFNSQGTRQVLAGFMCPITPTTYTIDFTITWDELAAVNTRYATIHVCAPDDRAYYSNSGSQGYADGYEIRFLQIGHVQVFKTVRTPASSTAVSPNSVVMGSEVLTPGETTSYRVAVSPTAIVVSRTDAGTSGLTYTASDSTYRGGYVHFGKADAVNTLKVSFSDVTLA